MSTGARLAAFGAFLAVVFGVATVAGGAVSPARHGIASCDVERPMHAMAGPMGVASELNGYRLVPTGTTTFPAGQSRAFRFRILDGRGKPVRHLCDEHGARLHLIVVRRDLSDYHHLHPRLEADGTWTIALDPGEPGAYRAFADFNTKDRSAVLGTDLFAPGRFSPRPLPAPDPVQRVGRYTVRMGGERAKPGGTTQLHFSVWRDGREVGDLQPYLGARGHLVALRQGDLAYLHVHPEEGPEPGAGITFGAEFPSAGRYRMFLQFRHAGRVHTAAFTEQVR
jgi:hypothetical protein